MAESTQRFAGIALAVIGFASPYTCYAQQKSQENAVASADDAFGTSVGLESTGIYNESNTRGFSPLDTGNARLDGVYFDPVSTVTLRVRASQSIRIGYAALDYPFPAPTGIVDNRLRSAGDAFTAGVGFYRQQYGSYVGMLDAQIPIVENLLGLAGGVSHGYGVEVDRSHEENYSYAVKPVLRWRDLELSPFYSANHVRDALPRTLVFVTGERLPAIPAHERYLGSPWAQGSRDNINFGATLKASLTDRLSLRAGIFKSSLRRKANFSDIFRVSDGSDEARHIVVADPVQNLYSWSGEAQFAYRFGSAASSHRLIAGFRGRDRHTEFGGSDRVDLGLVPFGVVTREPRPEFSFGPVNRGVIQQTAWLLGYIGRVEGLGRLNLGLQRASFRGRSTGGATLSRTRDDAWLYNASIGLDIGPNLLLYGGTQRGLEDSGAAPETAENRNEQLPPARSTQYEAGVRWSAPFGQIVVSAFEISKPFHSFGPGRLFTRLGTVRHRGLEASITAHLLDDRLSLLFGGLIMDPVVTGPAREEGLVGKRPPGTRFVRINFDAEFRTDLWDGLTPTLGVGYRGKMAAIAEPLNERGDQLMLRPRLLLDLGFRQPLTLGRYPATIRAQVQNVFDEKGWVARASRSLVLASRRRISASLAVDF